MYVIFDIDYLFYSLFIRKINFNILSTVICFQMHTSDYSQTDDKIFPSMKLNLIAG